MHGNDGIQPAPPNLSDDVASLEKGKPEVTVGYVPGANETSGLKRALNGRHTYMISLASGVGTGLFLGSGSALYNAGPLGLLLGYAACAMLAAAVAFISAETIGYLPVSGGFIRFIPRFSDKALGITIGYTFWYLLSITVAAEVVAASGLVAFWRPDLNYAIFISVFLALCLGLNLLPVRVYGESEFLFGTLKTFLIVGLILGGLLVDWGVSPSGDFIGGRYWRQNPIHEYLVPGSTGRFLAIWSTLINAAFAMGNIQITTVGAGEVANPRVHVPKAMRRIFWRLTLFYIASLFVVGLILDSTDKRLASSGGSTAASSPFVLAFSGAGIRVVPAIINAVVITSAFSSANGVLFLSSRVLVGLAADGYAPAIFLKTNRFSSPWVAVLASFVLAPLAYLNCGTASAAEVFSWFVNLIATAGLIVWCVICFTYVRFYYGLKHHGISRDELPYKSWGQPWCALAAGVFAVLIVFFSGFAVFFPGNWSAAAFLSNYIACFVVPALYVVLKMTVNSPWVKYEDMEFTEMDAIRTERELREAMPEKKLGLWRRIVEKVTDE